jgi:hypothetical protein
VMKFRREGCERIGRVFGECVRRALPHLPGACMTVPQTAQVRCETLE